MSFYTTFVPRFSSDLEARNWLMEIAEEISPIFKERKVDSQGNSPRYISVHDLKVEYKQVSEVREFYTDIHYLSDIGDWWEELIIKYFSSAYHFTIEKTQYDRLRARTEPFENINPVELIWKNENENVIIYQSPEGIELDDLGLTDEQYYYQLGILLAVLHSGETQNLDVNEYQLMMDYLMGVLPFSPSDIEFFTTKLQSEFNILKDSYAGYKPVTQFDLKHVKGKPLIDKITKSRILSGEAISIEILPELLEDHLMDRMEDIATIFSIEGFNEYMMNGNVKNTVVNLIHLFEGYESYFERYSTAPIDRVYPKGLSLDLHMIIGLWLYSMRELKRNPSFDMNKVIEYSRYVLSNNPFQIYG